MRLFAASWLITSCAVLNLTRVPSASSIIAIIVSLVIVSIGIKKARGVCAGILCSLVTLSIGLYQISQHQLPAMLISKDVDLIVKVVGVPKHDDRRISFLAQVQECDSCVVPVRVEKIQLSWYGHNHLLRAGEHWRLTVRLKPLGSLRNAGGFDAVKYMTSRGVYATGYVSVANTAKRLSVAPVHSLSGLRQSLQQSLQAMPAAGDMLSLIEALTLGIRSSVSDDIWQLLRNTGTAHLLAISGLHISLVAGWAFVVGGQCVLLFAKALRLSGRLGFDRRSIALIASVVVAIIYATLAGFELPTQRAVAMLSVWSFACWRYRILPPAAGLAGALILVLIQNPLNPLTVGFWLSFGTVSALFYLHSGHQLDNSELHQSFGQQRVLRRILPSVRRLLRTHVCLGIVLLPMTAWFFQSGSLVAPVANLIAVPWVGLICVPLSLLTLFLNGFAPALANALLVVTQWSLQCLISALGWLEDTLFAAMTLTLPGSIAMALTLIGLLVLFGPKGLGFRWLVIPFFVPMIAFNYQPAKPDGFDVHVLDVGQGLATLVFTQNQTLLFDTGGRLSSRLSMFEAAVMPFLYARGRRSIDTLVLSHLDEDHAFGLQDVLRRFPDIQIYSSEIPSFVDASHDINRCQAGHQWHTDGVSFSFLHPSHPNGRFGNNESCVMLIHEGQSRVLFTGDIEKSGETRLMGRLSPITEAFEVQLLLAPHHGSNSSSGQKLLDFFRPEYVVFSAGKRNRYGFPHADVQLRYKVLGAKSFTTGEQGTVSFSFGKDGLRRPPQTWWNSHRRFWHGIVNPDCWQSIAGQSLVLRLLTLTQKGQTLCGK